MNDTKPGRRVTLSEVVVVLLIVGALAVMITPICPRAIPYARITRCGSQISQLIKACHNYSVTKSPIEGQFHDHVLGEKWILWLYESGEIKEPRVFWCPVRSSLPRAGATNYRGPLCNPNGLGGDAVLIADRDDNHGDEPDVAMNYAVKSGSVHRCPRNSPMWRTTVPIWLGN